MDVIRTYTVTTLQPRTDPVASGMSSPSHLQLKFVWFWVTGFNSYSPQVVLGKVPWMRRAPLRFATVDTSKVNINCKCSVQ